MLLTYSKDTAKAEDSVSRVLAFQKLQAAWEESKYKANNAEAARVPSKSFQESTLGHPISLQKGAARKGANIYGVLCFFFFFKSFPLTLIKIVKYLCFRHKETDS